MRSKNNSPEWRKTDRKDTSNRPIYVKNPRPAHTHATSLGGLQDLKNDFGEDYKQIPANMALIPTAQELFNSSPQPAGRLWVGKPPAYAVNGDYSIQRGL